MGDGSLSCLAQMITASGDDCEGECGRGVWECCGCVGGEVGKLPKGVELLPEIPLLQRTAHIWKTHIFSVEAFQRI